MYRNKCVSFYIVSLSVRRKYVSIMLVCYISCYSFFILFYFIFFSPVLRICFVSVFIISLQFNDFLNAPNIHFNKNCHIIANANQCHSFIRAHRLHYHTAKHLQPARQIPTKVSHLIFFLLSSRKEVSMKSLCQCAWHDKQPQNESGVDERKKKNKIKEAIKDRE